jgi:methyl-accepting chemotaxis protein
VIQVVRTPTAEVDRRQRRRHAVNQTGRLAVAGQGDHTARVTDLSEGGALVSGVPDMRMGRTVTLCLTGLAVALACVVRLTDDEGMHVAFELDAAATAALHSMIANLTPHLAA